MTPSQLYRFALQQRSCLCVGLDTDPELLPPAVGGDVLAFNKAIIEATAPYCISYKFNLAFYEAQGLRGWQLLADSLALVPKTHFTIADAKRGDIGNTAKRYAQAFFEQMDFDALTVAPYMGSDSILPFLDYPGKWVFLLALTSNAGAQDYQLHTYEGMPLYKRVMQTTHAYSTPGHLGYVVGATRPEQLAELRADFADAWFLVPGVGAQGGDLNAVMQQGWGPEAGVLVNSSRGILYASRGDDWAEAAAHEAQTLQQQMDRLLPAL